MNMKETSGGGAQRSSAQGTEDYLRDVTVGKPEALNGPVCLVQYDQQWPSRYSRLASEIRDALSDRVLLLQHVGSTSVPGLCAKPTIDIVLAVVDSADEPSYVPLLEKVGFVLRIREPEWYEHRLLRAPDAAGNIHVFSAGCEEIGRMLAFRDWLRASEDDRRLYEEAKRELATRTWEYTQDYADAKSQVIQEILVRARRRR